ncbi:MAG: hypothetical protein FJ313_03610 [Gemmatimonadetes bacterium]|nr:hypothetical protein [Gemmatimonadota bacterium]
MAYSVQALKFGQCQVPRPEVYFMEGWGERETLWFMGFLIRGGGRTVLVNTGPPRNLSEINARWVEAFGFPEAALARNDAEELPERALARHGAAPADIDCVIVTPLQAYATANIPMFKNAQICISRRGWIEDWQAPTHHIHVPRPLRIPREVNDYLQNEGWEKLRLLADEDRVAPGITTFWAGVHHRSSLAICVDTEKGRVVITDSFFKYPNVEEGKYLGIQESMLKANVTYERLRREGDVLVPIYDPEVFERFPGGRIA